MTSKGYFRFEVNYCAANSMLDHMSTFASDGALPEVWEENYCQHLFIPIVKQDEQRSCLGLFNT